MHTVIRSTILLFSFATICSFAACSTAKTLPAEAAGMNGQAKDKNRPADPQEMIIAKGTKPVGVTIHNGDGVPEGAKVGMLIDIVGDLGNPPTTGIALINVKVLAFDGLPVDAKEQAVAVQLTPAQEAVMELMKKYGTKNKMVFHIKDSPSK